MMRKKNKSAFTMVELLSVIAIIAILGAAIGLAFPQGGSARLSSAENSLAAMIVAARNTAVTKNSTALLLINNDDNNPDKLRYMGIVYWDDDPDEDPETDDSFWHAVNEGIRLPQNIFFVPPDYNTGDFASGGEGNSALSVPAAEMPRSSIPITARAPTGFKADDIGLVDEDSAGDRAFARTTTGDFEIAFPRISRSRGDQEKWYAYAFNSSGLSLNAGAYCIIGVTETVGPPEPGQPTRNIYFSDPVKTGGYIIRRMGTAMRIPDPYGMIDIMEEEQE